MRRRKTAWCEWVKVKRRTTGIDGRVNLRNHLRIFQNTWYHIETGTAAIFWLLFQIFFLLHMVNYLEKSIFGRHSALSSRLSLTKSSALAEQGVKSWLSAVKCSAGSWTKQSTHRFPFLTVGLELRVPVHLCTPLSGKLMAGCSPKWEMVVGTHCEMVSFPSIAKSYTRQHEKKAGKILKRIS